MGIERRARRRTIGRKSLKTEKKAATSRQKDCELTLISIRMAERCYSTTCHPIGKETLKASQKVTTAGQCGHKTASRRVAVVRECRGRARNSSWKGLLASDRARAAELLEENICTPPRNGKECRTGKQVEEMGSHIPHSAEFLLHTIICTG